MKRYFPFLGALLVVCAIFIMGQGLIGYSERYAYNQVAYANDDVDTSGTHVIGGSDKATLRLYFSDSVSVVAKFDYRVYGASAWTAVTAVSADTIVKTAAGYSQIVLRDNVLERVPGISTQFRTRLAYASSANSANSGATATGRLEYSQ